MSFGPVPEALRRSIQTAGLINPPLVTPGEDGGWEVVCGRRRLRVLKDLGREACACRDLSGIGLGPEKAFILALHDNLATRDFNHVEKALALKGLEVHFPEADLLSRYLPLLGLAPREETLDTYRALAAAPEGIRKSVAGGVLSIKAFRALMELPEEGREGAAACIQNLRMSVSNQLQFIDLIHDLSEIEGIPIRGLLDSAPIRGLCQGAGNPPQETARLIRHLRGRRFPLVESAERRFRALLEKAGLPDGVRLSAPPWFEGEEFRLEIAFKTGRDLRETLEALLGSEGLSGFRPPWGEDAAGGGS